MCRGRGIAQQNDILMMPCFTQHPGELDPSRAADVVGIGHQRMTIQMVGEDLFADCDALVLIEVGKPISVIGAL